MGIDPGLRQTGWGLIRVDDRTATEQFHAAGVVSTVSDDDLGTRLSQIFTGLLDVLDRHRPELVAIEQIFVNPSPDSTLKLAYGRAAALLAAAQRTIPVVEYHNRSVKSAIVGKGNATKQQMQAMLKFLLPACDTHNHHAIDALCIAICARHHRATDRSRNLLERAQPDDRLS